MISVCSFCCFLIYFGAKPNDSTSHDDSVIIVITGDDSHLLHYVANDVITLRYTTYYNTE